MNYKLYNFFKIFLKPIIKFFYPYKVNGLKNVNSIKNGYVLCSNHLSNLDPVFLIITNPTPIHFMAKNELFKNKFLGKFFKSIGAFPVKRGKGDQEALNYAIEVPKKGETLGIFIEGTRSKNGEFLTPRSGATLIANKSSADILPVCITGSGKNNKIKMFKKTIISYGVPISAQDISCNDRIEMKNSTKLIMKNIKNLRGTEN